MATWNPKGVRTGSAEWRAHPKVRVVLSTYESMKSKHLADTYVAQHLQTKQHVEFKELLDKGGKFSAATYTNTLHGQPVPTETKVDATAKTHTSLVRHSTPEEKSAISSFTGAGYSGMREYQESGHAKLAEKWDESTATHIGNKVAAVNRLFANSKIAKINGKTLYRGIHVDESVAHDILSNSHFRLDSMASSSTHPHVAYGFANLGYSGDSKQWSIVFELHGQHDGLHLGALSSHKSEKEVLLPSGNIYKLGEYRVDHEKHAIYIKATSDHHVLETVGKPLGEKAYAGHLGTITPITPSAAGAPKAPTAPTPKTNAPAIALFGGWGAKSSSGIAHHPKPSAPTVATTQHHDAKQAFYQKLLVEAHIKGFKKGWAAYKYKDKYGTFPPWDWAPSSKKKAAVA